MPNDLSDAMPDPSLADLQHTFLKYLCNPSDDQSMVPFVLSTESVSAELRLKIYSHAYETRLTEALQDNFPALHTLLGDDGFYELAVRYIGKHPSHSFSLRYFGEHLSEWMRVNAPYSDQPVLSEMALFEWGVWAAFDAPDIEPATIDDLQAVPPANWGELTFCLHPSSQVLSLEWNVPMLWQAVTDESDPIAPERKEYPHSWLVWRQGLGTYFRQLDVDEAWALSKVEQGENFAYLCEGICEWVDAEHAAMRAVGFLQEWLADGVICLR